MAMKINFGGMTVPNVNKTNYKYTAFKNGMQPPEGPDKIQNIENILKAAWEFVEKRAAKQTECNKYFKGLRKNLTLEEILRTKDITLHSLWAKKENATLEDFLKLPLGNNAGLDIGINPYLLYVKQPHPNTLSSTLIHELAHVAGATSNPDAGEASHAAELALPKCLCSQFYDKDVVGQIQRTGIRQLNDRRIV